MVVILGAFKAQAQIDVEFVNFPVASSKRIFDYNTNTRWYFEGRINKKIHKYWDVGAAIGYQERNYIYFAVDNNPSTYRQYPLFMKRNFMPIALTGRLYLSEFFHQQLKFWKNPKKWDTYLQLGAVWLSVKDVRDPNEDAFRNLGFYAPAYIYPYVLRDKQKYLSYIFGVRYNLNKFSFISEFGEGMLTNITVGARYLLK